MLAFECLDLKKFMNSLLIDNTFDSFVFIKGSFMTDFYTSIDGTLNKDENDDNKESFISYKVIKPFIFQLIKGKKLPRAFKMTLGMPKDALNKYSNKYEPDTKDVKLNGLFINIKYENSTLSVTSACSINGLDLNHIFDTHWDNSVQTFFNEKGLEMNNI